MHDDSAFPGVRVLRGVRAADIAHLDLQFIPVEVRQGESVVAQDDPERDVFFVLSGRLLAVQWTAGGREIVFSRILPGDHLGELAALDGGARSTSVYAQADSQLLRLDQADFLKLALTGAGIDVKLYAPRGTLDYDIVEETRLGQTVPVVTRIFIDTPEREYPLSEGMLLVQ